MYRDPPPSRQGSASAVGLLFGLALLLLAGVVVDGERIRRNEIDQRAERIQAREWCLAAAALPAGGSLTSGPWSVRHDPDGTCCAEGPRYRLLRTLDGIEHWSRVPTGMEAAP